MNLALRTGLATVTLTAAVLGAAAPAMAAAPAVPAVEIGENSGSTNVANGLVQILAGLINATGSGIPCITKPPPPNSSC
ncbi:MAG: hypothetical protein JWN03_5280 [Nocardia sp.]|uniref:hypothetical protein n=1 Tax=Nocardia sp. TaxID=1821 RepID=UPI00262E8145|nr:hypothetical protein [Nocardia sp.]MCU1645005.1 hypothetical protein [Nocardia sp.]